MQVRGAQPTVLPTLSPGFCLGDAEGIQSLGSDSVRFQGFGSQLFTWSSNNFVSLKSAAHLQISIKLPAESGIMILRVCGGEILFAFELMLSSESQIPHQEGFRAIADILGIYDQLIIFISQGRY